MSEDPQILTINVGSSSLKLSVRSPRFGQPLKGSFQRLGTDSCEWKLETGDSHPLIGKGRMSAASDTVDVLAHWLAQLDFAPSAVAHRIVHGGPHLTCHCLATEETIAQLKKARPLAPEHVPAELNLLQALRGKFPDVPHVLCFDTVFHQTLPEAAFTLALPEHITAAGVRRYGFHGLAYEHLVHWLQERGEAGGRSILAHLGNGSSMAAVREGQSIDTTMGFTPAGGLVMGTRCGDLDPGIFRFLAQELKMDAQAIDRLINHESGLLGVSGLSGDVRELSKKRDSDSRAALALDIFARTATKHLCALAGVLGGADRIVFSGGIGENSPALREAILRPLGFLGLRLDSSANAHSDLLISSPDSAIKIFVAPADEEAAMARIVRQLVVPQT